MALKQLLSPTGAYAAAVPNTRRRCIATTKLLPRVSITIADKPGPLWTNVLPANSVYWAQDNGFNIRVGQKTNYPVFTECYQMVPVPPIG
jgi:hypothetical protein